MRRSTLGLSGRIEIDGGGAVIYIQRGEGHDGEETGVGQEEDGGREKMEEEV